MVLKLGVIGGGVMAGAILSRLLADGLYQPQDILVSEPAAAQRDLMQTRYGVGVSAENFDAAQAEVLLLAIKPQVFSLVAAELAAKLAAKLAAARSAAATSPVVGPVSGQLVLSILAGTPLQKLEAAFPGQPVIRVMPNTPATVGAGCTAIAPGQQVSPAHLDVAKVLFGAIGTVVEVPESMMDAVTGLSGSGPAYVAIMVEALADGGVAAGLPRAIAQQLALQTVLGTAELIRQSGQHPAVLKDQVTSPGGTTIAGVAALEKAGLRSALIEAVLAATARSKQLGQG